MILIRRLLGEVLRRKRQDEGRTLRQLAAEARISPGYLSEIERGQKEPSSELLAAICDALDIRLSDLLREVSIDLEAAELAASLEAQRVGVPVGAVPGARVGAAPLANAGQLKSGQIKAVPIAKPAPLAKPVARVPARPAGRPVRPIVRTPGRRVQPPVATASVGGVPVPAAAIAPAALPMLGPVTAVGMTPGGVVGDRVLSFSLLNVGDMVLR